MKKNIALILLAIIVLQGLILAETAKKAASVKKETSVKKAAPAPTMKAAATTSPAAFAFPRKNMPAVTFDHSKHLKQTGMICDTCHPKIFTQKRGGNPITMPAINSGKYCGVCHNGEKAPKTCNACHKKA